MMGATQTLTVWHRTKNAAGANDVWVRHVVPGCTWDSTITRGAHGSTAALSGACVCLLPPGMADGVAVGDLVALGCHDMEITGTSPHTQALVRTALLPDVFTVKTITNRARGRRCGAHIEIQGV